jgi:hypothetical protein
MNATIHIGTRDGTRCMRRCAQPSWLEPVDLAALPELNMAVHTVSLKGMITTHRVAALGGKKFPRVLIYASPRDDRNRRESCLGTPGLMEVSNPGIFLQLMFSTTNWNCQLYNICDSLRSPSCVLKSMKSK